MNEQFVMREAVQAHATLINVLWPLIKSWLICGGGRLVISVKTETRTLAANARLHAMLTDVSQQATYMNKKRSVEFWKGLFVSGWQIATEQKPEIVPGLEGEFINIRESTTTMTMKKISGVMEYIEAWGAFNDVKFRAQESDAVCLTGVVA